MLAFKEFTQLNEEEWALPKNTRIRTEDEGRTSGTSLSAKNKAEIAGYFEYKGVQDGRTITLLEPVDKEWFKSQNFPTTNVYRYYSNNNITSLLMLDVKNGKVKFFDNKTYEDTDKITFEPRWYKYKLLVIDNTPDAKNAFGVNRAVDHSLKHLI